MLIETMFIKSNDIKFVILIIAPTIFQLRRHRQLLCRICRLRRFILLHTRVTSPTMQLKLSRQINESLCPVPTVL